MPQVIPFVVGAVTAVTSAVVAAGPLAVAAFNAVNIAAVVGIGIAVAGPLLQPTVGSSGPTGEFKTDPTAPVRGVMGRYAIGGNKIFKRNWGKTNVYKTFVALLSLGPCLSVDGFKAGPLAVSFNQSSQGVATGKYAGHMWMRYRMGLPGAAALTPPSGVFIENPKLTAWTSAHKADGHVTAMWTLAQAEDVGKRDLYTQGEPDALWIGRWMLVWDPRLDSTYPGGTGTQRRDQWNTWGYSENPYLHALAWIRGHAKLNADGTVDRTKRIAGVGAPERAIDIPGFVEGANVADANGWKIAGEWSTSDDKWQVLAAMLQAGGGVPLNRGAQISCRVSTPRASIYTYTRHDLIGGATVKAMKPRRDRKNRIIPRYCSEVHDWTVVPAGAVSSSVYVTEDRGEPRSLEIEYSYVTAAKQAGELAAYDLANMREGLETSLPSKPHLLGLRAGDAFVVDVQELGLVGQKFIVQRRAFDPQTGVVSLDVLSETDGKHAWALGQTANPPPTPSLQGIDPDYVTPPELPEWTVIIQPPATDGSQQPGFTIIGGSATAQASSVVMEHGPSPTGPWKQFYDGALKTTATVPITGLQSGETYYVAVRYRRDENAAESERTIYGPYTAPSLISGDVSPTAPTIAALDAEIAALEALQASETVLRAEQITELNARLNSQSNKALNSTFDQDLEHWTSSGGWAPSYDPTQGNFAFCPAAGEAVLYTDVIRGNAGQTYTASWAAEVGGGGTATVWISLYNGSTYSGVDLPLQTFANAGWGVRGIYTFTLPVGYDGFTVVFRKNPDATYLAFNKVMVNGGALALPWNDQGTTAELNATVTEQSLAIIDLETGQALAKFELIAAATGGKPARFRLISSSLGSAIALDAPFIYWGDNTVFDDASDTLQTTVGGRIRIMALGAPFGASGNLLEWWGPTGIALSAMTTANGDNGRMTSAPYVFDNVLVIGGGLAGSTGIGADIGRGHAALHLAGETSAITVPASGKFIVNTQIFSESYGDGADVVAAGVAKLVIVRGTTATDLVTGVQVGAITTEQVLKNTSAMNIEVPNTYAGPVKFRVEVQGGGLSTSSAGYISGTLTANFYAS